MKRKFFIAGNWKMNGLRGSHEELDSVLAEGVSACDVLICPPAPLIGEFADRARGYTVRIGGQNCHPEASGAHTGEISAEMLADCGADAVICGHSERRASHGESDELVCAKAEAGLRAGLEPIICVGESAGERARGETFDLLSRQIKACASVLVSSSPVSIAYEPIWAIGTGEAAQQQDIEQAHRHIRNLLDEICTRSDNIPILYGGSVNPKNAGDIGALDGVGGLLIGGASLKAASFLSIIGSCKRFC